MLSVEKVYDELYGMIEDLKKQIAAGSGSDVSITPALESGTKVADFEIDGEAGVLYAPTPADPISFSTTERKIGTYFGADLYETDIIFEYPEGGVTAGNYDLTHNISDIDIPVYVDCGLHLATGALQIQRIEPTSFSADTANVKGTLITNAVAFTDSIVKLQIGSLWSTGDSHFTDIWIRCFYTKTPPETKKTRKKIGG